MALVVLGLVLGASPGFPGDCNGNGVPDKVDISSGASDDCNLSGLPDECEALPLAVGSIAWHPLPGTPRDLAVGDLDGDGLLDLAIATSELAAASATVILGPASGGEESRYPVSGAARGIDAGDLDGDGDLDLVVSAGVGLLLLLNSGGGSFAEKMSFAGSEAFAAVRVGDIDGDHLADVVAARWDSDSIALFRNLGGRRLADPLHLPVAQPGAVSLGDLDGDGDLDAAVLAAGGQIALLKNQGDGTFALPAIVGAAGEGLRAFALGDLEAGGGLDLAVIGTSSLKVLSSRGGGTFEETLSFSSGNETTLQALALGDADGDGDDDIILGRAQLDSAGEIQLFDNSGGTVHSSLPVSLGPLPSAIRVADLDGDGAGDVVVVPSGGAELGIFLRRGTEAELPLSVTFRTESVPIGKFEPHSSFLADLDGDGLLDLATMDGEYRVMVLHNQGDGTQGSQTIYDLRDGDELIHIVPADLDGDGDIDIAAVDERTNYLLLLKNAGDGEFVQTAQSVRTDTRPYFLVAADFDGDGDPDLVSANETADTISLFRNRGDGWFGARESLDIGNGPIGLAAGDFDADGDLDVAVAKAGSSKIAVLLNSGSGTFGARVDHVVCKLSYISATDLDGDGDLDLVGACDTESKLAILRGAGDGTFEVSETIDLGQPPRSVIATDVDGDGDPDLVTGNEDKGTISILLNLGGGAFARASHFPVGTAPRFVVAGDLDRDGDTDLVVANHTSLDFTFFFNETGALSRSPFLERACTELDFWRISAPAPGGGLPEREACYLVPASQGDPGLLPTVFPSAREQRKPWETLAADFPDRFGGLDENAYVQLVERRATRRYFAGSLFRLRDQDRIVYGFNVLVDAGSDPAELPTPGEVAAIYSAMEAAFLLRPLEYFPDTPAAREEARGWSDPGFPIFLHDLPHPFRRGDAGGDGSVNLTDAIQILGFLFRSAGGIACQKAADSNDDGELDISDAVTLLLHLFGFAGDLEAPFAACGLDPAEDSLSCNEFPPCGP